jgi:hypothetical protein
VTDFIREVDEDLRRENLEKLWRKYGTYALGAAVLVVLATAANVGWQRYSASLAVERAHQYDTALQLLANSEPTAADALLEIAADDDGYASLALLQAAAVKLEAGDAAGAAAIYERLAKDTDADKQLRDLAVILLALHTVDTADPTELTQRLQPFTADDSPWRYSALEITALLARRGGDIERAKQILTRLADDLNAPQSLRRRATEMLAALKG